MHARWNVRRLAVTVAVSATTAGAFVAFATTASAATGPTATVNNGTVTVTGTAARDVIDIVVDASSLRIDFGANGTVDAHFARSQFRQLQVLLADGDDGVSVTGTGDVPVTISGGAGSDGIGVVGHIGETGEGDAPTSISGNGGSDNLFAATPGPLSIHAGAGDDRVEGGGAGIGLETISLGDGNDRFVSSLNAFIGVRTDVVDGGAGHNVLVANGTFASEAVSLFAKTGHLIIEHEGRDVIDADNIQGVTWFGFGGLDGGDTVAVNDLSGTDVTRFTPNFSAPQNAAVPNNSEDSLTVRATAGVDHITVSGSGANITVAGLTPTVTPVLLDAQDTLRIDTLDGADTVDSSGLQRGLVTLLVL